MGVTIVVGGFFGDEGKGKITGYLANHDKPDIIARGGVGPNAGHTIYHNGKKFGLSQIPCGFVYSNATLYLGAGVLVNPDTFLKEVAETDTEGRIFVDNNCTVIMPEHIERDKCANSCRIGTTGTGCGPANEDRVKRIAPLAKDEPKLKGYVADVVLEVNEAIKAGKKVLLEGSQGMGLSLYHGTYPFVTTKDTNASAFCTDVGIGPKVVDEVIVIFKAYTTRVGEGPFPTEFSEEETKERGWQEYGTVTGRARRSGEFDYDLAKRAVMVNSATQLCITCLDKRFEGCAGAKTFDDLPEEARAFIKGIEARLEVPVTIISIGPNEEDVVDLRTV